MWSGISVSLEPPKWLTFNIPNIRIEPFTLFCHSLSHFPHHGMFCSQQPRQTRNQFTHMCDVFDHLRSSHDLFIGLFIMFLVRIRRW